MNQPQLAPLMPPLLCVTVAQGGRVDVQCGIPKLEAVKLLLSVVEELRMQAYQEHGRLIQVAPAASPELRG